MSTKFLSVFTERMAPDFVHRDHQLFTKFMRYYFEYLEQTDGVYDYTANALEYMDIDYTKEAFLEEFRHTYLINFPEETDVDVRFLVKKIREFYQSKGSEESYKFLFRLLYGDDDIDIYYPKLDILRSSDGKWNIDPSYALGGYWDATDGQLSSDKKLQDNYYYQDFSYEIITDVTRFYYENVVKQNIHVTGQLMFGKNIIETDVPLATEWLDYDKYDRLKNQDLGLSLLWGGGYVVTQEETNNESILVTVNGERVVEAVEYPFITISGAYAADDVIGIRRLDHAIGVNESFNTNGVQDTFNLDASYQANELMVWNNGKKMYEGIHYTREAVQNIVFVDPPEAGKLYVLKHTQQSQEITSGIGTEKFITLVDHPQGYLLNKMIIFGNGIILTPDWYDPLSKRVYFTDYLPDGTDNIEVLHMEELGYVDNVSVIDTITKYNISTNKNEFLEHPKTPYLTLIIPGDTIKPKLSDNVSAIVIFITPTDDVKLSLIERLTMLIGWNPTILEINPAQTDELSLTGSDISFQFPSTILSTSTDLRLFADGNIITVSSVSGLNDGTYNISAIPEENRIIISQSALDSETNVEAGVVTITTVSTGYTFNDDNPDSIVASTAKWHDVRHSDYAIITNASNSANNGRYVIQSATEFSLTLYAYESITADTDDTVAEIQIVREIMIDRLNMQIGDNSDPITAGNTVADDIEPKITEGATSIIAGIQPTDDILLKTTEGTTSISGETTAADDVETTLTEGTTTKVETSQGTDISFKANQTSGAQSDIDFDTTTTLSSPTFDLTAFDDGDTITISGSTSNDGTYTISGAPTAGALTIAETWTVEVPAAATTITTPAKINTTGTVDLSDFDANDVVTISGSTSNDATYNVHATIAPTSTKMMVDETSIITEVAGDTVDVSRTV